MKLIFCFFLLLTLSSCFNTYEITINKKGNAHVKISDWSEFDGEPIAESAGGEDLYSNYDKIKSSAQVSNYTRTKENDLHTVEFDIENVDSLEAFLFPIDEFSKGDIATFKYTKDKFEIIKTYDSANKQDDATMYGILVPYKAVFKFKRKIKKFSTDLDYVKQIDNRTIEINSDINTLSYGDGTYKVEVFF